MAFLTRWSKGLLIPGSTSDGWELTLAETHKVIDLASNAGSRLGAHVLVGALHPDAGEAARMIAATRARLGVNLLQQEALGEALSGLLALDLPMALPAAAR